MDSLHSVAGFIFVGRIHVSRLICQSAIHSSVALKLCECCCSGWETVPAQKFDAGRRVCLRLLAAGEAVVFVRLRKCCGKRWQGGDKNGEQVVVGRGAAWS